MRRRNAQQEEILAGLNRKIHARDEFLSAASHELRTPITTLSLQTEGLLSVAAVQRPPRRRSTIGCAGGSAPSAVRWCASISWSISCSTFRSSSRDASICIPEEIDLQALVIDAIDLMRDSATSAGSPLAAPAAQRGGGALGPRAPRPGDHQPALQRDQVRLRPPDRGRARRRQRPGPPRRPRLWAKGFRARSRSGSSSASSASPRCIAIRASGSDSGSASRSSTPATERSPWRASPAAGRPSACSSHADREAPAA